MTLQFVDSQQLLAARARMTSRAFGAAKGVDDSAIRNRLRDGSWQRLQRGVYAAFSGEPGREHLMWAALLRAGPGAVFSHQTAAEIQGLLAQPSPAIHITVPAERHPARWSKLQGVVIHRSSDLGQTRHPASSVPCTRVEDTVLDLVAASASFDEKFDWICRAVGNRRTTPQRLSRTLARRKRFPGRRETQLAIGCVQEGIMSWLELRWARGVERAHGFPAARRQVRVRQDTGSTYLDNLYEEYGLCVELDGRAAHPEAERRRDEARDRWNLAHQNIITVRYRVPDLRDRRRTCQTAAELAATLRGFGHQAGHPCPGQECREAFARTMDRTE